MRVLITGRSGSGKSTVCRELMRQGYAAFDGNNIPGLARWIDMSNGKPVRFNSSGMVDKNQTQWQWDEQLLADFLQKHSDVFVCGSADNQLALHHHFDKVFVLTLPPELQRQRITNRTEHNYGKLPAMQDIIIAEQQQFAHDAVAAGAIAIDAAPAPAAIVTAILEQLR
jgi:broad-specificity NMP kinase